MATTHDVSADANTTISESTSSNPRDITNLTQQPQDELPTSTPVEMSSLPTKSAFVNPTETSSNQATPQSQSRLPLPEPEVPLKTPEEDITTDADLVAQRHTSDATTTENTRITRLQSTAIGPNSDAELPLPPSKDKDPTPSSDPDSSGPSLLITLLLTTGARHPFKLDAKYLAKRNVSVPGNDPFNLSVYKLKELILREWRDEWETKPSSPSSIRLISFGKLLDDKGVLRDSKFHPEAPNVVHMTLKPQDYVEDEDAKGGKGSYSGAREGGERSPGCRCVIM